MTVDQHQISCIDDQPRRLAEDDDRIAAKQAVDRHENAAAE